MQDLHYLAMEWAYFSTEILPATSLAGLHSLPECDQIGGTPKVSVTRDIFLGDHLQAEWCPGTLCAEVLCDIILEATALRDHGGAVVHMQSGGSGGCGLDFQHLMSNCRYIHRQHHIGMLKALSSGALELCRPAVFPKVSWEKKYLMQANTEQSDKLNEIKFSLKHDKVREVVMNWQKMMAIDRWIRGSLPSVESLNCIFRLSWRCSFLMKVIPLHSIKQSVSCVTTPGICLSNVSFSEHLFASAAGRNGDKRPKDTSTVKYILSSIIQT